MAATRKAKPSSPDPGVTDPVGSLPVEILEDGAVSIQFPAELLAEPVTAPVAAAPPEAEPEPIPSPEVPPAGSPPVSPAPEVVAPAGPTGTLLAALNEARRQAAEQEARARHGDRPAPKEYAYTFQRPDHPDHNYDQIPTLTTALERALAHQGTTLGRELLKLSREERGSELSNLRMELAVDNAVRMTGLWSTLKADYREKVEQSGVNKLVEIDTATGRPIYPDKFDPVTRRLWLTSPDPGAFAYQLAEETLAEQKKGTAPAGGSPPAGTNGHAMTDAERADQIRTVIAAEASHATHRAVTRPQGIASIPAGGGTGRTVIRSVDDLTREQLERLAKERPDVINLLEANAFKKMNPKK